MHCSEVDETATGSANLWSLFGSLLRDAISWSGLTAEFVRVAFRLELRLGLRDALEVFERGRQIAHQLVGVGECATLTHPSANASTIRA